MSGYTPAFSSIYDGSLYGKWPTAAVWASLLPLIDARGEINLSYDAIAGRTGWPMDLLRQGIDALMQPDPASQSQAEEGRRLVLIDPSRTWGWRAVNVKKYRDKASGKDQVNDGRNAEKVRRYKERHRETPEDTAGHRSDTYSYSNTDSNTNKEQDSAAPSATTGKKTPEGEMAVALRDLGVAVRSTDPVLHAWLRDGFTVQQATDAVGIARIRKPHPEAIPANYLDKILRQPARPPPQRVSRYEQTLSELGNGSGDVGF